MARKSKLKGQEELDRAVGMFSEAKSQHSTFVERVESRYTSWRGVLEANSKAASWTSKLHPPYVQHIIETSLASLIDDTLRYKIRPRHTLANPETVAQLRKGAEAHQIIFDWQTREDKLAEIQRPFILQNAIAGVSIAKTYWTTKEQRRRQLVNVEVPVLNPATEEPIYDPFTGKMVTLPQMQEKTKVTTIYDGPTTEVVDVRDFFWHEAATSLETSDYLIHRTWMTWEQIEDAFGNDAFGENRGGWTLEQVKKRIGDKDENGDSFTEELGGRESSLFNMDRTKNRLEVLEVWDRRKNRVITVLNRTALLAARDFPFWHEKPPFTACVTQPDLFMIPGISVVEKIKDLQSALWTTMNQRIDNLNLVNNAIFWFRPDIEDIDEYTFEPGARWPVEDPTQIQAWAPNPMPAEVSLGAEQLFKGDLQNLAGGFPFSSGADSGNVDQTTATGASLVTGLAQRSVNLAKGRIRIAFSDIGDQRLVLNQQFLREPMLVPVLGVDDEEVLHEIWPEILAGDYSITQEITSDAATKQEEQASEQAKLQMAMALAPVVAQLSQAGAAKMINMDAYVEDFLHAFGIEDTDRYFVSPQTAAGAAPPGPGGGGGGGAPAPPGSEGPGGTTAPAATDSTAPANQVSQSPAVLMQRALAARGGANNQ